MATNKLTLVLKKERTITEDDEDGPDVSADVDLFGTDTVHEGVRLDQTDNLKSIRRRKKHADFEVTRKDLLEFFDLVIQSLLQNHPDSMRLRFAF